MTSSAISKITTTGCPLFHMILLNTLALRWYVPFCVTVHTPLRRWHNSTSENIAELQKALNAVYEYCNSFKLTANTTKTKVMLFSNGKIRILPHLFFGNNKLEVVSEYQYFGILFNCNGSFKNLVPWGTDGHLRCDLDLDFDCGKKLPSCITHRPLPTY